MLKREVFIKRTRMPGGVGRGREKLPLIRLDAILSNLRVSGF